MCLAYFQICVCGFLMKFSHIYIQIYLYMTVTTVVQEQLLKEDAFLSPPHNKHFYAGMSFYKSKSIEPTVHESYYGSCVLHRLPDSSE